MIKQISQMYMYVPDIYHYYVILCNTKICVIYKEHVRRNNVCSIYTDVSQLFSKKKKGKFFKHVFSIRAAQYTALL